VDYVVVREGKNIRGHVIAALFATAGKSVLAKAFHNSVRAIDRRTQTAEPSGS